jgi:hypothetical protein
MRALGFRHTAVGRRGDIGQQRQFHDMGSYRRVLSRASVAPLRIIDVILEAMS